MASFLKRFFQGNSPTTVNADFLKFIGTDVHSHALPGLDDGAESMAQSLAMIRELQQLGYQKLILTPHIMGDFYKNTTSDIKTKMAELQVAAQQEVNIGLPERIGGRIQFARLAAP